MSGNPKTSLTIETYRVAFTYRGAEGPTGLGKTVEVYAKAFPDMHRELYRVFKLVVVELALQGTHKGPLPTPIGIVPATGKRMDAPCCDVFRLVNGKIQSFNCYPCLQFTFTLVTMKCYSMTRSDMSSAPLLPASMPN